MTLELVPWRGAQVPLLSRATLDEMAGWIVDSSRYQGPPMPVMTYGSRPAEPISYSFEGFVRGMLYTDGPVASVEAYRLRVFGQAPLLYQELVDGRAGDWFDDDALDRLRSPWPGGHLADLMKRSLVYGDFGGNAFVLDIEDELVLVRPDWVEIVLEKREFRGAQVGWRQKGILYYEGGLANGEGVPFLPGEYAHFVPGLPDPLATYRGMSWLTPLVREVQADKSAADHKALFFENAASPNLAVSLPKEITPKQFEEFVDKMDSQHKGVQNAYKTLYTAGGADVTVVGANMQQMDFSAVQGKGETRVANAGGVPPTLLSFSEGMQGSSLNAGNYTAAKRNFVDTTMRDLWQNWCGSLQQMDAFAAPKPKSRLWYDGRDIPFLHEDAKDLADIQQQRAATINSYVQAGWTPDTSVSTVAQDDVTLLEHSGLMSVQLTPPGAQDPTRAEPGTPADPKADPVTDPAAARAAIRPGQRYRHGWVPIAPDLSVMGRPPEHLAMKRKPGHPLDTSGLANLGEYDQVYLGEAPPAVQQAVRRAFDGTHNGVTARISDQSSYAYRDPNAGLVIQAEGTLSRDGRIVGSFRRRMFVNQKRVHNDTFALAADEQGQGVSKAFNRQAEPVLADLGFERVTVSPTGVGGLAWADYGWDPAKAGAAGDVPMRIGDALARLGGQLAPADADELRQMLDRFRGPRADWPTPADVRDFGKGTYDYVGADGRTSWPGRDIMLMSNWAGERELRSAARSLSVLDEIVRKFDPSQPRDPHSGEWMSTGGAIKDALKLANRIHLGPGETLTGSHVVEGNDGDLPMAWTHGPDGAHLRLGVGISSEDTHRWRAADLGSTVVLDEDGVRQLSAAVDSMRQAGAEGVAREKSLTAQESGLQNRQRALIRKQYPNLTAAQSVDLDRIDSRLPDLESRIRSDQEQQADAIRDLPAHGQAEYASIQGRIDEKKAQSTALYEAFWAGGGTDRSILDQASGLDNDIEDLLDQQVQLHDLREEPGRGRVGYTTFFKRRRAALDKNLSEQDRLLASREELTANPVPLPEADAAELTSVSTSLANVDRELRELTDDGELVSGVIPAAWGDLAYQAVMTDTGPSYDIGVRPAGAPADWAVTDAATAANLDEEDLAKLRAALSPPAARSILLTAFHMIARGWSPAQEAAHPRNPKGGHGGGRFRSLTAGLAAALHDFLRGDGADDPLDGFNREQLRKAAVALDLKPRRGASSDELKLSLLAHARQSFRDVDAADKAAPKVEAKFTLKGGKAPSPELVHQVETENKVRAAYRDLPKSPAGHVGLADLREHPVMAALSRDEQDAALLSLAGQRGSRLTPVANRKSLTARDRASALRVGEDDANMIAIDDPSPRPLPKAESPKLRGKDVAVFHEADGKVSLYEESDAGHRGARVTIAPDLAGLESWARDNGETELADWAAKEGGKPEVAAPVKVARKAAKRAPAKKVAMPEAAPAPGKPTKRAMGDLKPGDQILVKQAPDGSWVPAKSTRGAGLVPMTLDRVEEPAGLGLGLGFLHGTGPDGSEIAVYSTDWGPTSRTGILPLSELLVVNPDGTGREHVLDTPAAPVKKAAPRKRTPAAKVGPDLPAIAAVVHAAETEDEVRKLLADSKLTVPQLKELAGHIGGPSANPKGTRQQIIDQIAAGTAGLKNRPASIFAGTWNQDTPRAPNVPTVPTPIDAAEKERRRKILEAPRDQPRSMRGEDGIGVFSADPETKRQSAAALDAVTDEGRANGGGTPMADYLFGEVTETTDGQAALTAAAERAERGEGIKKVKKFRGGAFGKVERVEMDDGTVLFHKRDLARTKAGSEDLLVDAPHRITSEQLGAEVLQAAGVPTPRLHRYDDHSYYAEWDDSPTSAAIPFPDEGSRFDAETMTGDAARRLAIVDLVTGNWDRNEGNWKARADPAIPGRYTPIAIDNSSMWTPRYIKQAEAQLDPFDRYIALQQQTSGSPFVARNLPFRGEGAPWLSNEDLDALRDLLTPLRPQFVEAGRESDLDYTLANIEALRSVAEGSGRRLW